MTDRMMTPTQLLQAWHEQQKAFIEFRDLRTRTIVDVLARVQSQTDHPIRVVDLGCGPGSLATAFLEAIPTASAVGVDRDPILVRLARETNQFGDRLHIIEADVVDPDLPELLGGPVFDAAVSATALHWLDPDALVRLYQQLPSLLSPGGVFMNADHLFYDAHTRPWLDRTSIHLRDAFQVRYLEQGTMSWDSWWDAATSMPGWHDETRRREAVWADDHRPVKVSAEFHLAALRAAGFRETDQIYQWFDDRIIFGRL